MADENKKDETTKDAPTVEKKQEKTTQAEAVVEATAEEDVVVPDKFKSLVEEVEKMSEIFMSSKEDYMSSEIEKSIDAIDKSKQNDLNCIAEAMTESISRVTGEAIKEFAKLHEYTEIESLSESTDAYIKLVLKNAIKAEISAEIGK